MKKNIIQIGILLIVTLIGHTQAYSYSLTCKKYSKDDKDTVEAARKLVFFASWCESCITSIKSSDPKQDIYIAVFDTLTNAQQALQFVLADKGEGATCFWDEDKTLAKQQGVTSLPRTIIVK